MPADGISLPQTKGNFGTSRWAARRLGYINLVTRRKGHDRYWHLADMTFTSANVRCWGKSGHSEGQDKRANFI